MPNIGTGEILIVAVVIIVLFGGKKIPELIKGISTAIREFKKSFSEKEEK